MSDSEEYREIKEFLHKIDKSLAEARGDVQRLTQDVTDHRRDMGDVYVRLSQCERDAASTVTIIQQHRTEIDRHESRADRLVWGLVVGLGTCLISLIGLVLNEVFGK